MLLTTIIEAWTRDDNVISSNFSIPNMPNMPMPTSAMVAGTQADTSSVGQLLNETSQLTNGLQMIGYQNQQAQELKEIQQKQKLALDQYQAQLLASLPANQSGQVIASGLGSPTDNAMAFRSASMPPPSSTVNTVDQITTFVKTASTEAEKLIKETPTQVAMTSNPPAIINSLPTNVMNQGGTGNADFINPLPSGTLTSPFGTRVHPISGVEKKHEGQDLAAPEGTPIMAAAGGKVTINDFDTDGYGNWIEIKHPNGKSTRYGHMKDKSPLAVGTQVSQGQQIGLVGSTGGSTGPHLHFEIRNVGGVAENPVAYLPQLDGSQQAQA